MKGNLNLLNLVLILCFLQTKSSSYLFEFDEDEGEEQHSQLNLKNEQSERVLGLSFFQSLIDQFKKQQDIQGLDSQTNKLLSKQNEEEIKSAIQNDWSLYIDTLLKQTSSVPQNVLTIAMKEVLEVEDLTFQQLMLQQNSYRKWKKQQLNSVLPYYLALEERVKDLEIAYFGRSLNAYENKQLGPKNINRIEQFMQDQQKYLLAKNSLAKKKAIDVLPFMWQLKQLETCSDSSHSTPNWCPIVSKHVDIKYFGQEVKAEWNVPKYWQNFRQELKVENSENIQQSRDLNQQSTFDNKDQTAEQEEQTILFSIQNQIYQNTKTEEELEQSNIKLVALSENYWSRNQILQSSLLNEKSSQSQGSLVTSENSSSKIFITIAFVLIILFLGLSYFNKNKNANEQRFKKINRLGCFRQAGELEECLLQKN